MEARCNNTLKRPSHTQNASSGPSSPLCSVRQAKKSRAHSRTSSTVADVSTDVLAGGKAQTDDLLLVGSSRPLPLNLVTSEFAKPKVEPGQASKPQLSDSETETTLNSPSIDTNNDNCLLSYTAEDRTPQAKPVVHETRVLSQEMSKHDEETLRVAWKCNELVEDLRYTRFNTILLSSPWHDYFYRGHWMLVPEPSMIEQLYEAYVKPIVPYQDHILKLYGMDPDAHTRLGVKPKEFTYYMIPRSTAPKELLVRLSSAHECTTIQYPYSDLGPITSHVHPHFVIIDAALKLAKGGFQFYDNMLASLRLHYPDKVKGVASVRMLCYLMRNIYREWMSNPPPSRRGVNDDERAHYGRRSPPASRRPPKITRRASQLDHLPLSSGQEGHGGPDTRPDPLELIKDLNIRSDHHVNPNDDDDDDDDDDSLWPSRGSDGSDCTPKIDFPLTPKDHDNADPLFHVNGHRSASAKKLHLELIGDMSSEEEEQRFEQWRLKVAQG